MRSCRYIRPNASTEPVAPTGKARRAGQTPAEPGHHRPANCIRKFTIRENAAANTSPVTPNNDSPSFMLVPIGHLNAFIGQAPLLSPVLKRSPILRETLLLLYKQKDGMPLNNRQIASKLWISAVRASDSMQILRKAGLVITEPKEGDRRERCSVLSEYGIRQARTIRKREMEFVEALRTFTGWDSLRVNSFLKSLRYYSKYLESANARAAPYGPFSFRGPARSKQFRLA